MRCPKCAQKCSDIEEHLRRKHPECNTSESEQDTDDVKDSSDDCQDDTEWRLLKVKSGGKTKVRQASVKDIRQLISKTKIQKPKKSNLRLMVRELPCRRQQTTYQRKRQTCPLCSVFVVHLARHLRQMHRQDKNSSLSYIRTHRSYIKQSTTHSSDRHYRICPVKACKARVLYITQHLRQVHGMTKEVAREMSRMSIRENSPMKPGEEEVMSDDSEESPESSESNQESEELEEIQPKTPPNQALSGLSLYKAKPKALITPKSKAIPKPKAPSTPKTMAIPKPKATSTPKSKNTPNPVASTSKIKPTPNPVASTSKAKSTPNPVAASTSKTKATPKPVAASSPKTKAALKYFGILKPPEDNDARDQEGTLVTCPVNTSPSPPIRNVSKTPKHRLLMKRAESEPRLQSTLKKTSAKVPETETGDNQGIYQDETLPISPVKIPQSPPIGHVSKNFKHQLRLRSRSEPRLKPASKHVSTTNVPGSESKGVKDFRILQPPEHQVTRHEILNVQPSPLDLSTSSSPPRSSPAAFIDLRTPEKPTKSTPDAPSSKDVLSSEVESVTPTKSSVESLKPKHTLQARVRCLSNLKKKQPWWRLGEVPIQSWKNVPLLVNFNTFLQSADREMNSKTASQYAFQIYQIWKSVDPLFRLKAILTVETLRTRWLNTFMNTKAPGTVKAYLGCLKEFWSWLASTQKGITNITLAKVLLARDLWIKALRKRTMRRKFQVMLKDTRECPTVEDFAKFQTSNVKERVLELLTQDLKERGMTKEEWKFVTGVLMLCIAVDNAQRTGAVLGITMEVFANRTTRTDGTTVLVVLEHKTSTQGPAYLVLTQQVFQLLDLYLNERRKVTGNNMDLLKPDSPVFIKQTGESYNHSEVNRLINHAWRMAGGEQDISFTKIRKSVVTLMRTEEPSGSRELAQHMTHSQQTADAYYHLYRREETSANVTQRIRKVMNTTGKQTKVIDIHDSSSEDSELPKAIIPLLNVKQINIKKEPEDVKEVTDPVERELEQGHGRRAFSKKEADIIKKVCRDMIENDEPIIANNVKDVMASDSAGNTLITKLLPIHGNNLWKKVADRVRTFRKQYKKASS